MAIDVESYKQKRYGIVEQATWGTAMADSSVLDNGTTNNGVQLDIDALSIQPAVNVREGKQSQGTRRPFSGAATHDTNGVSPIVTLPAFEAKKDDLDLFLYLVTQSCSEAVGTPFLKTYTIADGQPDFSANAGFFTTFFERFATASKSRKINDAIARSLTLTLEPGGRLMVAGELIGRGAMTENANPSGAWSRADSANADYFFFEYLNRCTIDFGSGATAMRLTGPIEFTFSHDCIPFGHDGSGAKESFAIANWQIGVKLQVQDDPTVNVRNPFEAAHRLKTICDLEFGWGNDPPSADGDFEIICEVRFTDISPDGAPILGLEATGVIETSDITNSPITMILGNAIDRGW
jgi:hypothetical protein